MSLYHTEQSDQSEIYMINGGFLSSWTEQQG